MRRSASEIISELESRIARLERKNTKLASDFDPRKAIMYFSIDFEDYNAEEDGVEFSDRELHKKTLEAQKKVGRILKVRISNEGHDSSGNLICKFGVDSLKEAAKIFKIIQRGGEGGTVIETGVEYFIANFFTLYPQGVNGIAYQMDAFGPAKDLEEYLEDQGVL